MKNENLKWCCEKAGWGAPSSDDSESAQRALAAYAELDALKDAVRALRRFVRASENGNPSMIPALTDQAREALKKVGAL
jgi:cell division protein FtsB